ncbi:MAG: hypothetical protein ACLQU5_22500 [Isosphaeraceae bacterium]
MYATLPTTARSCRLHPTGGRSGITASVIRGFGATHAIDVCRGSGTEREISANIEHQESATKDLCFLVSILQVRAKVVSFSVSFPKSTLHALIAFLVSIPRRASMDG